MASLSRQLVAGVVTLLCTAAANGQDYLEPEASQFSGGHIDVEYQSLIVSTLTEAYGDGVRARMVAVPSFSPEYAVGIREAEGGHRIFVLTSSVHLYGYMVLRDFDRGLITGRDVQTTREVEQEMNELRKVLPADSKGVRVDRCEIDIDQASAEELLDAWERALLLTRYSTDGALVTDGVGYHFSMFSRKAINWLAGMTRAPFAQDTIPFRLVQITEIMRELCEKEDLTLRTQLTTQVSALLARLRM